jgi:hypothetical protein
MGRRMAEDERGLKVMIELKEQGLFHAKGIT